jgi:hypothetical protein
MAVQVFYQQLIVTIMEEAEEAQLIQAVQLALAVLAAVELEQLGARAQME